MKLTWENIDGWIRQRIKLVTLLIGFLLLASFFSLRFIRYNNNIEFMLPADSQVQQSMRFLRESNFSDKLVISLKLTSQDHSTQDLIRATDALAGSINSPLVKQIITGVNGSALMPELIFFLKFTPQLLSPDSLAKLDQLTSPAGVQERLGDIYRQSLSPQSTFSLPFLRLDPFQLSFGILNNIQKLTQAAGYNVTLQQGHFLTPDGQNAMIILKTSVLLTDGFGSRQIINYLSGKLAQLPAYVKGQIIAGHLHTVKNEDSIKNDIRLTSIIAGWGFILLFLFAFRDIRAMIIFLIPVGAVLVTTWVTYLIFGELSYFVIGLSTVIAGIADDYGIYVYMAVRHAGNNPQTIAKIRRPVIVGALTTVSVFIVFFFSSVPGYHELAFFSNFSVILCLLYSLFILPHYVKQDPASRVKPKDLNIDFSLRLPDRLWILIWIIVLALMLFFSTRLKFNNDVTQFDGAGESVLRNEEEFSRTWGNRELPAVLVVQSDNIQEAYQINGALYRDALLTIKEQDFSSLAAIWPGGALRRANLDAWQKYWTPTKIDATKELFTQYGQAYGFAPDAFEPFFQQLEEPADLSIEPAGLSFFRQLKDQFVLEKNGLYQIISFFPDTEDYVKRLSELKEKYPGTFIVSRKNFSRQLSQALAKEFAYLWLLSTLLTLGLMIFSLKNLRLTVIALIPIITSLALVGGVTYLCGLAINIPVLIAAMVVMGLVSDYAIFMVYYCKYRHQTGTITAVTLASVTTLIGAAVLLFARHPLLFSIGVTLTAGILSGYLSSLILVPVAYRLWKEKTDAAV